MLPQLARSCFESGVSASKWVQLVKLYFRDHEESAATVSNSVLILFRSFPGDVELQEYLKAAIANNLLPLQVFLSTFLQAAQAPDLHHAPTLDILCRMALDAHYTKLTPTALSVDINVVHDGIALLRTAYSLPVTRFHQLTVSASELVNVLLNSVTGLAEVSAAQAMSLAMDANYLLQQEYRLSANIRQSLENFVLSLTFIAGDDSKAAREAQMMQTLQIAQGKGDILGPNSNTDLVTLGLELNHFMQKRLMGNTSYVVALLVATFRWTSWSPATFYTQLLLVSTSLLAQSKEPEIWRAFILGRLPHLLLEFEKVLSVDIADIDWRSATQSALANVIRRTNILTHYDLLFRSSLPRDMIHQFLLLTLIDQRSATSLDPTIINDPTKPPLDGSEDLESTIEAKLHHDVPDFEDWLKIVFSQPRYHSVFAAVVSRRFSTLSQTLDSDPLAYSHLCRILYSHPQILDIISLHVPIRDIIYASLSFLEVYDLETVGDPQTAVGHVGEVVLFLQVVLCRFELNETEFGSPQGGKVLTSQYLRSPRNVESLPEMAAWLKVLFDSNSEGIDDAIIRSTRPQSLLLIAPRLFSLAVSLAREGKIDTEVLHNGVSYFTGPLLNWTLVGVVKRLVIEIEIERLNRRDPAIYLNILQTLILTSCPQPVLMLSGHRVLALLASLKQDRPSTIDFAAIEKTFSDHLGIMIGAPTFSIPDARTAVQTVLSAARSSKVPQYDMSISYLQPATVFLRCLWNELVAACTIGEMENARRVATFIITMPPPIQEKRSTPLLPIFMHVIFPALVGVVDKQVPPEQTISTELLATLLSSLLSAALHLELAWRSYTTQPIEVVNGQASSSMARRLATRLRSAKDSHTCTVLLQRLTSSQSFVANFPVFMGDRNSD